MRVDAMTVISSQKLERAKQVTTVQEAVQELRENSDVRTVGDVLRAFSRCDDPKELLTEGLMLWNPEICRENLSRKVRNWLGGKTHSLRKKDAFILSRVLGLSLEETDSFLKMVTGEGIHWRDPQDIVWAYAAVQNLNAAGTNRLLEKVGALGKLPKENRDPAPESFTRVVYGKLEPVLYGTEEELLGFLMEHWQHLGTLHNTAFQQFDHYITTLERGFSDSDVEADFRILEAKEKERIKREQASREKTARTEAEKENRPYLPDQPGFHLTLEYADGGEGLYRPDSMSTRDVLETYLYRRLVPVKENKKQAPEAFSAIQRSIREGWPDEFSISKMKARQMDVSRKMLILLFLATDGADLEFADWDVEEEPLTQDQVFQDVTMRLELMLHSCGFPKLDPRSPFDWLVLYCLCAGDLWETDKRLENVLKVLFRMEENTQT